MKRLVCAVAVVSLSVMGCGGSLCEDLADSFSGVNEKVEDCPSFSDFEFEEPTDAEIMECEENFDSCSDKDKEIIEKFTGCVNDLDKCEASDEDAFSLSFLLCIAPLENLSEACGEVTAQSSPAVRKGLAMSKNYSSAR